MTDRFCKDCRFSARDISAVSCDSSAYSCLRDALGPPPLRDPVTGIETHRAIRAINCAKERAPLTLLSFYNVTRCGPEGRYFERRTPAGSSASSPAVSE